MYLKGSIMGVGENMMQGGGERDQEPGLGQAEARHLEVHLSFPHELPGP